MISAMGGLIIGLVLLRSMRPRPVVGGQGEDPLSLELQEHFGKRIINLAGRISLRQTAALLKHCQLYLGNDTGPMHLAAAVGVPVVEISAHPLDGSPLHPNSTFRFGPWGFPHVVLQPKTALSPCVRSCNSNQPHCILDISVEQVKEAVRRLWSGDKSPTTPNGKLARPGQIFGPGTDPADGRQYRNN